ncbi:MAG: inorganic pyrophosphatase [Saprospiraceae bacterium]|nr:inorganic pyrophosphatase [Saprospiraceae bacterium]MBK6565388.1 inorganic pyrophosphatase [Saprospiraceae bacterium]MBK6784133.1 inorganic pyrophosphatase [Saprospiraceae bacterium]MBK7522657.1 inorganic pyrophosphatase [Saprospiraceae bacterium]MBK8080033.1 inorganic pyrophosphatase [Saprospiraceae bacterium]
MYNPYKLHPWHGVFIGNESPECVTAFIEIIPSDTVKYEIDKASGYLMVDRPQKFSNIVPALYGFIPQTYCAEEVALSNMKATNRSGIIGDGDPLDILVLTEREITHGDIIVKAIPIGGFRLLDNNEADDKIIAILKNDEVYNMWKDIQDVPKTIINRLKHYFLTYKQMPDKEPHCVIDEIYGKQVAQDVIRASIKDYQKHFIEE